MRVLGAVLLALTALSAVAGAASASKTQPTMLQDDKLLVGGSQQSRDARLDEFKSLGVDIVKVRVSWRSIAPSGSSKKKPSFNAADPNAYPASAWAPYDAIVRGATARGMGVLFQLGGSAPAWATSGSGKNSNVSNPNANEFRSFVQAVGTRYSGGFGGSAAGGGGSPGGLPLPVSGVLGSASGATSAANALPRVTAFSVWNEPNLKSWLSPQVKNGVPYAPVLYRRLLYAAADGLQASGHSSDQLLLGELLPFARSGRTGNVKMRPVTFLRELGCLDGRYRPYRGKAAKKRGCTGKFRKLPGTGVAFHPYTLGGGPNIPTPNPEDASIATLSRITGTVDRLFSKGRLVKRGMPLWITEFGFQSNPPDHFATPLGKIPGFMGQSELIAFKNGRVLSYSQYPLVDDSGLAGFQSGLRFRNNKPKPGVYAAFAHTIYVRQLSGSRVEVFGCERAATSGSVSIQSRTGKKGKWKTVASAALNQLGYFDRTLKASSASKRQWRYVLGNAKSRVAAASKG